MLKLEISSSKSKNKQIYPADPTRNKTYDCRQMFEESQCQKNMNVEINCLNRKASGLLQVSQKRLEKQRQSIAKCRGEPWISQMFPQMSLENHGPLENSRLGYQRYSVKSPESEKKKSRICQVRDFPKSGKVGFIERQGGHVSVVAIMSP